MSERSQNQPRHTPDGSQERPVFFIPKIVLTGGPCGGKTTTLDHLLTGPDLRIQPIQEAATMLIRGGFPVPGQNGMPYTPGWQVSLQTAIIGAQRSLEEIAEAEAQRLGANLILQDRGLADNIAYLPGGQAQYEELAGEDMRTTLSRYYAVLHLGTFAKHNTYQTQNNDARFEDATEALRIDERLIDAWAAHPRHFIIDTVEGRQEIVSSIIRDLLRKANL